MSAGAVAHSLQVHFLTAGRTTEPMRYEVRPLMRGRNFSVQQVIGNQGDRLVDPALHQAALAYVSDYWFSLTAMAPLIDARIGTGLYVASLNHTGWFHHPARADEWLLVDAVAPFNGSARGLTTGQVYRREGALTATLAQYGLYLGWIASAAGGYTVPGSAGGGL